MQIECGYPGEPKKLYEEGARIPIFIGGKKLCARIDLLVHFGFIGEDVARRLNLQPSETKVGKDGTTSKLYLIDVEIRDESASVVKKTWFIEDKDEAFTANFGEIVYVGREFFRSLNLKYDGRTGSVTLGDEE